MVTEHRPLFEMAKLPPQGLTQDPVYENVWLSVIRIRAMCVTNYVSVD